MTTEMESACCQEVSEIFRIIGPYVCITDHLSFVVVCLDPEVLQTALVTMRNVRFKDFDVLVPQGLCDLQLIVSSPGGYTHDSIALLGGSFLPVQRVELGTTRVPRRIGPIHWIPGGPRRLTETIFTCFCAV